MMMFSFGYRGALSSSNQQLRVSLASNHGEKILKSDPVMLKEIMDSIDK